MDMTRQKIMNRIELLRSRKGRDNQNIIKKLERQLRHLTNIDH